MSIHLIGDRKCPDPHPETIGLIFGCQGDGVVFFTVISDDTVKTAFEVDVLYGAFKRYAAGAVHTA